MAKTIKFNLMLNGVPVRNIEGLQENFCINEVLEIYNDGLLLKWLKVRDFTEYIEKLEEIHDSKSVIKDLIKIFNVVKSDKEIKEAIYALNFWENRKEVLDELNRKENKVRDVIEDYHNGYEALKLELIEHKTDMPFIKKAVDEICNNYLKLFKLDFFAFFQQYRDESPLVIYSVLMKVELRDLFLSNEYLKKDLTQFVVSSQKVFRVKFQKFFHSCLANVNENKLIVFKDDYLGNIGLKSFCGQTDGYWKDLEVKNKQVMVLSIPTKTFVRNLGKPDEELSSDDIDGNFIILNGLDYKSNNLTGNLVYMEL
ncbi:MAG: hypothetical protein ACPG52_05805 [Cognaticolwellia sp.]